MKYVLFVIMAFALIGFIIPNAFSATTVFDEGDEKIILEKEINVNLILVGDSWTSSEVDAIKKDLLETHEPIYLLTNKKVGIKYTFDYNFLTVAEEDSKKLYMNIEEQSDTQTLNGPISWWLYAYHGIPFEEQNELLEEDPLLQYNAEYVENQIYEIIIKNDQNLMSRDNINLIFLSSSDYLSWDYLKNYFIDQRDTATDTRFIKDGLTGYGGNYNFYYFDLYAMPWIELDFDGYIENPDDVREWFYTPLGMGNLHDCTEASCFSNIVHENTNSAIEHIASPSFVYPVDYYPNYLIDLVVYNAPIGSSIGVTKSTLPYFVDEEKVISELNELYPFANFEIEISTERRDTRGISLDFKDEIKRMTPNTIENPFESYNYSILNTEKIKPHLLDWAQERILTKNLENTKTIPVLLVLHDSNRDLYLDKYGVTGYAPGMPDDATIPCCSFAVMHQDQVWDDKVSGTDLVIHEVGHTLGLAHPFTAAIGQHNELSYNPFWNNYASPMTYSSVQHGCGLIFSIIHPDETCGMANRSFTIFETNAISNMAVVSLIQKTNQNLEKLNKMESDEIDNSKLNSIIESLSTSKSKFNMGQVLQKYGAIDNAKSAYIDSISLLGKEIIDTTPKPQSGKGTVSLSSDLVIFDRYKPMSTNISGQISADIFSKGQAVMISVEGLDLSEPILDGYNASLLTGMDYTSHYEEVKVIPTGRGGFSLDYTFPDNAGVGKYEITVKHMNKIIGIVVFEISNKLEKPSEDKIIEIPSWIKNNAGWWAEGTIDDNSFVQGIQFMIKEDVISIQNIPESSSETTDIIPSWIKNNAGWWAEGTIDDNSFVQGIEYLVKVGIIDVR